MANIVKTPDGNITVIEKCLCANIEIGFMLEIKGDYTEDEFSIVLMKTQFATENIKGSDVQIFGVSMFQFRSLAVEAAEKILKLNSTEKRIYIDRASFTENSFNHIDYNAEIDPNNVFCKLSDIYFYIDIESFIYLGSILEGLNIAMLRNSLRAYYEANPGYYQPVCQSDTPAQKEREERKKNLRIVNINSWKDNNTESEVDCNNERNDEE